MVSKQWTVEPLNATVRREIRTLPVDMIDEFVRISGLIEEHGIEFVSMPHVRHIRVRFGRCDCGAEAGFHGHST